MEVWDTRSVLWYKKIRWTTKQVVMSLCLSVIALRLRQFSITYSFILFLLVKAYWDSLLIKFLRKRGQYATKLLVEQCPLFTWKWGYMSINSFGNFLKVTWKKASVPIPLETIINEGVEYTNTPYFSKNFSYDARPRSLWVVMIINFPP